MWGRQLFGLRFWSQTEGYDYNHTHGRMRFISDRNLVKRNDFNRHFSYRNNEKRVLGTVTIEKEELVVFIQYVVYPFGACIPGSFQHALR